MNPYLEAVAGFHEQFQAPILDMPQIPSPDRCKLRVSLLDEELDELRDAIAKGNIVGVADALCDLQYVLSGAVLEFGLKQKFDRLFAEVDRSNKSKSCPSSEVLKLTQEHYSRLGIETTGQEVAPGVFNCYRASDNKVLKSILWREPDLPAILTSTI